MYNRKQIYEVKRKYNYKFETEKENETGMKVK